uniref:Triple QxxK/R motif-containing protein n=1 Tax=Gasterosteus aculeatus aculeatus TaxID=481459 RepID=A0AAQ4Q1I5_GASAC
MPATSIRSPLLQEGRTGVWDHEGRGKELGKQDYKKTKSALKATRLKAEAKKNSSGFKDAFLVIAAILFFVLCVYAFFYLNLSNEINMDLDVD